MWKRVQDEMADEKHLQKQAQTIFFPVKYIKIPDTFSKSKSSSERLWASLIVRKVLLHIIIWMSTNKYNKQATITNNYNKTR